MENEGPCRVGEIAQTRWVEKGSLMGTRLEGPMPPRLELPVQAQEGPCQEWSQAPPAPNPGSQLPAHCGY